MSPARGYPVRTATASSLRRELRVYSVRIQCLRLRPLPHPARRRARRGCRVFGHRHCVSLRPALRSAVRSERYPQPLPAVSPACRASLADAFRRRDEAGAALHRRIAHGQVPSELLRGADSSGSDQSADQGPQFLDQDLGAAAPGMPSGRARIHRNRSINTAIRPLARPSGASSDVVIDDAAGNVHPITDPLGIPKER